MKKKTIGILVCTLLITSVLPVVGLGEYNETKAVHNTANEKCDVSFFEIQEDASNIQPNDSGNINILLMDQLDQQQTTNTGAERIQEMNNGGLAQSFKPSLPTLTRVSVLWTKSSGDPEFANYYIEIRSDIHSSSYLRKIQIDKNMLQTGTVWYIWDFTDLAVTTGGLYFIVVYADSPTIYTTEVKWCYGSPGYPTDPYPDGMSMIYYGPSWGWSAYDLWGDFCFKTYGETGGGNNAPNTPSTPSGPPSAGIGVSCTYSTSATDPDGDQVRYYFDWDDGSGDWTILVNSGQSASASHSWGSAGTYQVKAKAQDDQGAESGFSSALAVTISTGNSPPNKPDTPSGPASGKVFTSYTYTSSAIDPEGNKIYLMFDWGDGTNSGWLGLYNSGDTVTASHSWSMQGSYVIKTKAKDEHDVESVWSDPLPISVPKTFSLNVETCLGDQIDQQQTIDEYDTAVLSGCSQAQSFVPTLAILTRVELKLRQYYSPNKDISVSIRTDLNGDDLTLVSKPPSQIPPWPNNAEWIEFDFEDIGATPGQTYFIVCSTESYLPGWYYWRRCDSDVYPHGDAWNYGYYGDYWSKHTPHLIFALRHMAGQIKCQQNLPNHQVLH